MTEIVCCFIGFENLVVRIEMVVVQTFGTQAIESFLGFAATAFGFFLFRDSRIYLTEQLDLGIVGFDCALHGGREMMIEDVVTFAAVSCDGFAGARSDVLRVDGEEPAIYVAEGQTEHLALLAVGGNHHAEHCG